MTNKGQILKKLELKESNILENDRKDTSKEKKLRLTQALRENLKKRRIQTRNRRMNEK